MESDSSLSGMKSRGDFLVVQLVTGSRIPLAIVFCCFALTVRAGVGAVWIGVLLLTIIEVSDAVDGYVARRLGVVSPLGEMLDPYADSFSRLVVFWTLSQCGLVFMVVPLVMALRDVTVAYCRILLAQSGASVSARLGGKIKAHVQGIGGIAAWIGPWYWGWLGEWTIPLISWMVILVTIYSSYDYLRGGIGALRERL